MKKICPFLLFFALLLVACNKEDVYTASYKFIVEEEQKESEEKYKEGDYIDITVSVIDYNYKEVLATEPLLYGRKTDTAAKLVLEDGVWILYSNNTNKRLTAINIESHHIDNCVVDIYIDYPPHPIGASERRHMPFAIGEQVLAITVP